MKRVFWLLALTAEMYWLFVNLGLPSMAELCCGPMGMKGGEPMSSKKLSCGTLETQPLSEPLEPVADMQCDDSELSVAGERKEGHSDNHDFGLHITHATHI